MSIQTEQPQTQQQPVVVYPNTVSGQGQVPPSHSHSNGSFGTVFIVLAVIIVISAIACFLGRLCNRRMSRTKPSKEDKYHKSRPKNKERDIEFGFDGKAPGGKPGGGGGGHGGGDPSKGFKMPGNGDPREFRMPGPPVYAEPAGIRMPGDGHGNPPGIRMPGNGIPPGIRMPGNGGDRDHVTFKFPGHGDIKGDSKHFDDPELKAGA
ncbi:hypothetical protein COLO4_24179 [Corchorus olitorius]|uniref:Uncharacterized protein n=1 Tax=Corchorus olitorius TaxID=93759 RepID=A0A1R3IC72_9ROSI|nr:hypothetical protein COLO4_24179 [Corchorus olitorius]